MGNKITIAYFTCRETPKIEWFFWSFAREMRAQNKSWNDFKFIIIDYDSQYDYEERSKLLQSYMPKEIDVVISPPKPTPWQGKDKLTSVDYFAASSARNTAFIMCETDYIVCVDDLSVVKEGWLNSILLAQNNNEVVLGAYAKAPNLICYFDGSYSYDAITNGLDSRFNNSHLGQMLKVKVAGSWLFGCSFGLPLEVALEVDGFDESCDGQGAEDYDFGIRIERSGASIFYDKRMFTYENDELHSIGNKIFKRDAKVLTKGTMMLSKLGIMSDHAKLQYIIENKTTQPFFENNLREQKEYWKQTKSFWPYKYSIDWRTGESLNYL